MGVKQAHCTVSTVFLDLHFFSIWCVHHSQRGMLVTVEAWTSLGYGFAAAGCRSSGTGSLQLGQLWSGRVEYGGQFSGQERPTNVQYNSCQGTWQARASP